MKVDCPQMLVVLLAAIGCAGHGAGPDASAGPGDASPTTDGPGNMPSVGAHAINFYHQNDSTAASISTPVMATHAGSTIVVSVGRGVYDTFLLPDALPTDTKGNAPYRELGDANKYTRWTSSGTALYASESARGGANQVITTKTTAGDEVTLAAVEVVDGTHVEDFTWNEVVQPDPIPTPPVTLTSGSVKTTGPATLIAFWWGDGYPDTTPQTATPNNDFIPIEANVQELHAFVQCAVAVRSVTKAGTYDVTWTATPAQGAQMWLIAVQ